MTLFILKCIICAFNTNSKISSQLGDIRIFDNDEKSKRIELLLVEIPQNVEKFIDFFSQNYKIKLTSFLYLYKPFT